MRGMATLSYDSALQRDPRRVPRDLVRARELLLDLVWKDLRVRYRYTAIGFLWALLQPLALMLILTFVFTGVFEGRLPVAADSTEDFAVMILCGLVFWQFFASALSGATRSIVDNQNLIKKVHFPREVLPLAAVLNPLVNLGIGLLLLLAIHLFRGGTPSLAWCWFAPLLLVEVCLATGLGLLCAAGQVRFQDVGYLVEIGLLFGFYASPVFYPLQFVLQSDRLPAWSKQLYLCNPMAGLLTGARAILFDHTLPALGLLAWPLLCAIFLLLLGGIAFRRSAPTFSDHL